MKTAPVLRFMYLVIIGVLVFTACTPTLVPPPTPTPTHFSNPAHNQTLAQLVSVLASGGALAEDLLYSCLLNYYQQGIPLSVAIELCTPMVLDAADKGFGGGFGGPFGNIGGEDFFNPGGITADCSPGDPAIGQITSDAVIEAQMRREMWEYLNMRTLQASQAFDDALAAKASERELNYLFAVLTFWGDQALKQADLLKAAEERLKKQLQDSMSSSSASSASSVSNSPSSSSSSSSSNSSGSSSSASSSASSGASSLPASSGSSAATSSSAGQTGGSSECEEALQNAREFLWECHRTGWKSAGCQQLLAKMNDCPDPTQILVDPEQGYACGLSVDAATLEALKTAWVAECEKLMRPVPGGPNPCEPPTFDKSQRTGHGEIGDVCNDPAVMRDPENNDCVAILAVKPFGEIDLQQLAVWGLNKFGGPIIVLPPRDPTDPPGPPKPN